MSDQGQTKAVRWQASGLVLAALISTTGVVTQACIQSGWFGKPAPAPAEVADSLTSSATPRAYFTGTIEPLYEPPPTAAQASAAALEIAPHSAPTPALLPVPTPSKPLLTPRQTW